MKSLWQETKDAWRADPVFVLVALAGAALLAMFFVAGAAIGFWCGVTGCV